jgi:hypothetical protein
MWVVILIEKHKYVHIWCFTHRICKSDKGICFRVRLLEVVQTKIVVQDEKKVF